MKLHGRLFITGEIATVTGLHIGGSGEAFAIGGVDNPVIKNQINGQPYIPGSSLRGKMRSLTEKYMGRVTGQRINNGEIHACQTGDEYAECPICNIYGISAGGPNPRARFDNWPTRLVVRDVALRPESARELEAAKTSLPFTEVKTEVAIDRATSQANPRDIERVPAGAVFAPMELVYSIYDVHNDVEWLSVLLDAMDLLQDDYLGGSGSRGGGKVVFANLSLELKRAVDYRAPVSLGAYATLADLSHEFGAVQNRLWDELGSEV